ncbi:hypothetical protein V7S43_002081 [Phytophthora oleae]|uniref:Uncharacterized protein n=1 Tax=Phytophthora oleae TaxID=2107226 RepID=A0ABD3G4C7_9STRA
METKEDGETTTDYITGTTEASNYTTTTNTEGATKETEAEMNDDCGSDGSVPATEGGESETTADYGITVDIQEADEMTGDLQIGITENTKARKRLCSTTSRGR